MPYPLIPVSSIVIFNGDIVNITYAGIWYLIVVMAGYRGRLIKKLSAVLILYPLVVAVNFLVPYVISIEYNRYPSPAGIWNFVCMRCFVCWHGSVSIKRFWQKSEGQETI